ncbi:hypothetical protein D3C76_1569680 [compost metagenome]
MPIMAMDDVRHEPGKRKQLQHGPVQKRKPLPVIPMPIDPFPAEIIFVIDHIYRNAFPVQVGDAPVLIPPSDRNHAGAQMLQAIPVNGRQLAISRHDDPHIVSGFDQRFRQRADHVG